MFHLLSYWFHFHQRHLHLEHYLYLLHYCQRYLLRHRHLRLKKISFLRHHHYYPDQKVKQYRHYLALHRYHHRLSRH